MRHPSRLSQNNRRGPAGNVSNSTQGVVPPAAQPEGATLPQNGLRGVTEAPFGGVATSGAAMAPAGAPADEAAFVRGFQEGLRLRNAQQPSAAAAVAAGAPQASGAQQAAGMGAVSGVISSGLFGANPSQQPAPAAAAGPPSPFESGRDAAAARQPGPGPAPRAQPWAAGSWQGHAAGQAPPEQANAQGWPGGGRAPQQPAAGGLEGNFRAQLNLGEEPAVAATGFGFHPGAAGTQPPAWGCCQLLPAALNSGPPALHDLGETYSCGCVKSSWPLWWPLAAKDKPVCLTARSSC